MINAEDEYEILASIYQRGEEVYNVTFLPRPVRSIAIFIRTDRNS